MRTKRNELRKSKKSFKKLSGQIWNLLKTLVTIDSIYNLIRRVVKVIFKFTGWG